MTKQLLPRDDNGNLLSYAWPGGYPIFYICTDSGILCPDCARMAESKKLTNDPDDKQWHIVEVDINYEDENLHCDHCSKLIEAAYSNSEKQPAD